MGNACVSSAPAASGTEAAVNALKQDFRPTNPHSRLTPAPSMQQNVRKKLSSRKPSPRARYRSTSPARAAGRRGLTLLPRAPPVGDAGARPAAQHHGGQVRQRHAQAALLRPHQPARTHRHAAGPNRQRVTGTGRDGTGRDGTGRDAPFAAPPPRPSRAGRAPSPWQRSLTAREPPARHQPRASARRTNELSGAASRDAKARALPSQAPTARRKRRGALWE